MLRLGLGKNQTYQALKKIREVITRDVPGIFEGIVEVDETYLGSQKKNKRKSQLKKKKKIFCESKKGLGPPNSLYLESCVGMAKFLLN